MDKHSNLTGTEQSNKVGVPVLQVRTFPVPPLPHEVFRLNERSTEKQNTDDTKRQNNIDENVVAHLRVSN